MSAAARFFALTAAFSLPFLLLGAVLRTPEGAAVDLPPSALQVLAPFLAAVVLVQRAQGWRGVRRLLSGSADLRLVRRPGPAASMVLVMPAVYLVAALLAGLMGRPAAFAGVSLPTVAVLAGVFLLAAYLEEVGWTGYALGPLHRRLGPLGAALLIGVVCAAFHVVADLQGGQDLRWIVWQRLGSVMLRVIVVYAVLLAGGTTVVAVAVHASDNISWAVVTGGGAHHDPMLTTAVAAAAACALLLSTGRVRAVARNRPRPERPRPGRARR